KSPTNGFGSLVSTFPVHTSTESCHRTLRTAARAWEQSLARTRPPDLEGPRYRLRQNHPLISSGSFRFGNCRYRGPEDRSFRNPSGGSFLRSEPAPPVPWSTASTAHSRRSSLPVSHIPQAAYRSALCPMPYVLHSRGTGSYTKIRTPSRRPVRPFLFPPFLSLRFPFSLPLLWPFRLRRAC